MLGKYIKTMADLFLPPLCFCCEKRILEDYLCGNCQKKLMFLHPPLCRFCAKPLSENLTGVCKNCQKKTFSYERLLSILAYREPLISLIHPFKYTNCNYLGQFLSSLMINHLKKIEFKGYDYDLITAVPMHKHKLKSRGYNQAEILGKLLSNYFKIPFQNDIIYDINIRPQQAKLSSLKRKDNIEGAFKVEKDLKDKSLILVDDIFTTGSTARACSEALKAKGAQRITVITLAKTI